MYTNIHALVGDVKTKIERLHSIVDVLLSGYRTGSDIIDSTTDHRQKYVEQLLELNKTLGDIVDTHPAFKLDLTWQNITTVINDIVATEQKVDSVWRKA